MPDFVIPAPAQPSVAVASTAARFPVRRIFCVGRNYAAHAREMGNDAREPPFFFTKPADAVTGGDAPYPPATANLHYEAELVVAIGKAGRDIAEAEALGHIWGYAPGNDLTRRDLQAEAKEMRRPWDMAKGFDASAVCGALLPVAQAGHPSDSARLSCSVNGELRQQAPLGEMIWPVPAILGFLSRLVALRPGDLVYTGTPAGVGALARGDSCTVAIEGLGEVTTRIV
ncbi:fumarylacetoacetate hydrolase family protein [Acidimangrovimonas pyrenivorans]|uniref:Fumarylacetoacetate hydrolase family protein n=1 Tax=Acidimangrovimonas pyrenivorans TaxID=2030798 RepID=A0ABV7AHV5_9RHOB